MVLRRVKSKEELMKMFRDKTKYMKYEDSNSYCQIESQADFIEDMFCYCGQELDMTKINKQKNSIDNNRNYDFSYCEENHIGYLFKEEWLEPLENVMLRRVKSKEELMKMFRDKTKYLKMKNHNSYEHKESKCDFEEKMFDFCGKEIEMFTPSIEDNNFDFEGQTVDGVSWLFKEEWLEPLEDKLMEITVTIVTAQQNADDIIRKALFGKLDIYDIKIKEHN